jgi:uncharacterized oligopeptide transporter (OPT) family protein
MATMIKGQLSQQLPWGPVLVGVFLALMAQLAGAHALSRGRSVLTCRSRRRRRSLSAARCAGWSIVSRALTSGGGASAAAESDIGPGMLYATGLVAGGSLAGMLIAFLQGFAEPVANRARPRPRVLDQARDSAAM